MAPVIRSIIDNRTPNVRSSIIYGSIDIEPTRPQETASGSLYRAVARDVTINKIYFRVAKYEQKCHNSQAHYEAKTSNRLL